MKVFVTVGTTKFDLLIETILSPQLLKKLYNKGYNKLTLQTGECSINIDDRPRCGFKEITVFNYSFEIKEYVMSADLIISHAGAGSILDALEANKPLVVVTNLHLMHNHQLELAEELYKNNHLYYCSCNNLVNIIEKLELEKLKPFVNTKSKGIATFIDKVMGFG
ncbi:UDP-N-acetylglucosamine transferase subunit ALG13 [Prorops nasuta]|uniref:UDP-N-acetylglucosamine transferase subunit ALG13 n=1 Tax=Prorops nasuta TaxID=863751 RepID=UPI0034CE7361